jgi:nucleoside-diphosphate-sugar epimerase
LNSVVTTRNLLDACRSATNLRRFVNVSTFAVHSNLKLLRGGVFDESCPLEDELEQRHDAYVYAKLRQDQLVQKYHQEYGIPYVTVRPSAVIGPGKHGIPAHVGIGTFGLFLHIGGSIRVPLTYVDNCADAIALAALKPGVEGEVFQVVDDDLPRSRSFLKQYKSNVRRFKSVYVPYPFFYLFCALWEKYSGWSQGQLPPVFNRRMGAFYWKGHRYSNRNLKEKLGWKPRVPMAEALKRYFVYQKEISAGHA